MEEKFFYCNSCGNLAIMAIASGVTPECCGEPMEKLHASHEEEGKEKHIPVVQHINDHKLKVCISVHPHPMTDDHCIKFICLETSEGGIIHYLKPGDTPEACFRYVGKPKAVYAYCNVHGLWRCEVKPYCGYEPKNQDNVGCRL